jgi:hypothetical protein
VKYCREIDNKFWPTIRFYMILFFECLETRNAAKTPPKRTFELYVACKCIGAVFTELKHRNEAQVQA